MSKVRRKCVATMLQITYDERKKYEISAEDMFSILSICLPSTFLSD